MTGRWLTVRLTGNHVFDEGLQIRIGQLVDAGNLQKIRFDAVTDARKFVSLILPCLPWHYRL